MSEQYVPIKESLGYRNVKLALRNVFSQNIDELSIHEGMNENFNFSFNYKKYKMLVEITSTGKNIQFEFGEGGVFDVLFLNPDYPEKSIFEDISFYELIPDTVTSESIETVFGRDEKAIEHALRVLKDFLDSDEARVLLKKSESY